MLKVEKTVFISYRRTNIGFALAIYQNLRLHGYDKKDIFLDYISIPSGAWAQIITENIKSRAHFLIVLTPSALERVHEPGDWLRREIELAMDIKRNIIPLTFEGFDWKLAREKYLTGKLAALAEYQALTVPIEFFEAAMDKLCSNLFLNKPLDTILHPRTEEAQQAADERQQAADSAPPVPQSVLTAEEWFERGYQHYNQGNFADAIADYNEAIRLEPDDATAYSTRGVAKANQGDYTGALADYSEAIRLTPDDATAYSNRGVEKYNHGDYDGAIADFTEVIRLKSGDAAAYNNRGLAKYNHGDYDGAIADYSEAIRLEPDDATAYSTRGVAKANQGDYAGAIADYSEAIHLKSDDASAYSNRGEVYFALGQYNQALADFQKAHELNPGSNFAVGGLAVTLHKLGETAKALNHWKMLTGLDPNYRDADWAADTLNWPDAMREEARKLVAKL